jgi:ABC-type Na+ efflux pump permease subunit
MNKLYLIVPLVLTLAFGGIYLKHRGEAAVHEQQTRADADKRDAAAAAQKADAERQARADADKRDADRLAEEKKKEDDKRAKWDADTRRIATDTATFTATAAEHAATLKKLEAELTALRAEKDAAIQSSFDFARDVELARIQKRTAELEIQRLVGMVARKNGAAASLAFAP